MSVFRDSRTRKKYGEIIPKKYHRKDIKAIAHYCFLFFDQFRGSAYGTDNSFRHSQGFGYKRPYDQGIFGYYNAEATWTQYAKQRKKGHIKYRWDYGFNASAVKQIYYAEITYTGKMTTEKKTVDTGHGDQDRPGAYRPTTYIYNIPIYTLKFYQAEIEEDLDSDDGSSVWNKINGIPIYYVKLADYKYEETCECSLDGDGNVNHVSDWTHYYRASYKEDGDELNGIITYEDPAKTLKIQSKRLVTLRETSEIFFCGMPLMCNTQYRNKMAEYVSGYTDDNTDTTTIHQTERYKLPKYLYLAAKDGKIRVPLQNGQLVDYDTAAKYMQFGSLHHANNLDTTPIYPKDSVLSATTPTYVVAVDLESLEYYFENTTFHYYHKIDADNYEEIRIKNYNVNWRINQNEGSEHFADSCSPLAPSPMSYIPVCPDLLSKLSFYENLTLALYSQGLYVSYWKSEKKSGWVMTRGIFFTVVGIIIVVVLCVAQQYHLAALVAQGVVTAATAAVISCLLITSMILSIMSMVMPSGPGKTIFAALAVVTGALASSFMNAGAISLSAISIPTAIEIGCSLATVVFDMVYANKQSNLSEQQSANQSAYESATDVLSEKTNSMLGGASVSSTGLANTYSGMQTIAGLNCDEVTDLMVSSNYVGDLVYASMDLDLDVFRKVTNGTGYGLYNFEKLWNEGSL